MTSNEPDYDDTDMTSEEFDLRLARALPADVTNLGGRTPGGWERPPAVGAVGVGTSETLYDTLWLRGNVTITRDVELAGK